MGNKTNLLVSLGKAFKGIPPSLCGRQVAGPPSLPVAVAQYDKRLHVKNELIRKNHFLDSSFTNQQIYR